MKGYLANGLFSHSDAMYNSYIASVVRQEFESFDLFLPQESEINDKSTFADSIMIADADMSKLMEADVLIAVIDGVEIDSGVSAEIGIFSTTGRPIIGIYTDIRQQGNDNADKVLALVEDSTENQFMYRNLFTVGLIKKNGCIINDIRNLIIELKKLGVQ